MNEREMNECPRCQTSFICRADDIDLCQCRSVRLNDAERSYISEHFDDCLCTDCMKAMKEEYFNRQIKNLLKPKPPIA